MWGMGSIPGPLLRMVNVGGVGWTGEIAWRGVGTWSGAVVGCD